MQSHIIQLTQISFFFCLQTFCKKDLPEKCRVIGPNSVITMEFRTDRLNVYVMEDGVVSRVNYG